MKGYKLIVLTEEDSRKVQEKAFKLGYYWRTGGQKVQCADMLFLYLSKEKEITSGEREKRYLNKEWEAISVDAFLEMEKPKKYPYIGISSTGQLVLFTGKRTGIKLNNVVLPFGNNSSFWDEEDFKEFTGNLCIKDGKPVECEPIDLENIEEPMDVMFKGKKVKVVGVGDLGSTFDYIVSGYSGGHSGEHPSYKYFDGYGPEGSDKFFVDARQLSLIED